MVVVISGCCQMIMKSVFYVKGCQLVLPVNTWNWMA